MTTPLSTPKIVIYGKSDCIKCERAKEKMQILKVPYTFIDFSNLPPSWRDFRVTDARALYEDLVDSDPANALPIIEISREVDREIDSKLFTYAAAMKELRS